jgi:putative transposase
MARVPASQATRNALKKMFERGDQDFDQSQFVRQAVRLMIEEALEAEVNEQLGRGYYERGAATGYRNGNRLGRLKSAEGAIEYTVPQVRGAAESWQSEVRAALVGRTEELERLAVEMYARGLSVRDIEAAFTDERGRCVLSKSAASQVSEQLWQDYQVFASRDLSEHRLIYLYVDGVAERLHVGQAREAVLAAWGITQSGHKVLLGLAPGTKEDTPSCRDFLRDSRRRVGCSIRSW